MPIARGSTARWNQKEAGGKHSKEEYDNRIMEANATNMEAKKRKKMCLQIHAKKHGALLLLTVSANSYIVSFLVFVDSLRRTFVICVLSTNIEGNI